MKIPIKHDILTLLRLLYVAATLFFIAVIPLYFFVEHSQICVLYYSCAMYVVMTSIYCIAVGALGGLLPAVGIFIVHVLCYPAL